MVCCQHSSPTYRNSEYPAVVQMNKKEILELKRRFKKDEATFTRLVGCYVDGNKNKLCKFGGKFLSLEEEEYFKYLEIFYARSNDLRFTKSVTVPAPNGKTVSLDLVHPTSDANIYLQVYGETITISETTITPVQGNMYGVSQTGFNYWQKEQTTGGNLYIYMVVGYN